MIDHIFQGSEPPDELSIFLHAPHVSDASLAPPRGAAFVLSPVPHLGDAALDGPAFGAHAFEAAS